MPPNVRSRSAPAALFAAATAAAAVLPVTASAQVDNVRVLVDAPNATNGASLSTSGYLPARPGSPDAIFSSSFGGGGSLRRTANVDGTQESQRYVSQGQLELYYRDGDTNRAVSTPLQSGLVLNPLPVGPFPAHSFAIITDAATTRLPGSSTVDPAASKRVYRYDLRPVADTGDGRDVFTTLVTLEKMRGLKGNPTSTSSNAGRQGAFASNGASFYFAESSAAFGGLYKTDVLTGATALLVNHDDINTEPAVLPRPGGLPGDRILFRGTTAGGNAGGINFVDHDGATTGGEQTWLSAAALADFLERPAGGADVRSMTADAAGNVYFYDNDAETLVRRDAVGRLSKVATRAERTALRDQLGRTGTVNVNMLRLQPRTVAHPTAGPVTEIMYADQGALNAVAAAIVFAAGDFNRDGSVGPADAALLKPVLTTRGVPQTVTGNYKFDLNGNRAVDWRDVKVFQQFYAFDDGDADINRAVDFGDLDVLSGTYLTNNRTWTAGDFTGDNAVTFADLLLLTGNWDPAKPTAAELDARGYTGQFRTDVEAAFAVPEPGTASAVGLAAVGLLAARRRRRYPAGDRPARRVSPLVKGRAS